MMDNTHDTFEYRSMMEIGKKNAELVQEVLENFYPEPYDRVNQQFFDTVRVYSLMNAEHTEANFKDYWQTIGIFHVPILAFSVGRNKERIFEIIKPFFNDDLAKDLVAPFAEDEIKIELYYLETRFEVANLKFSTKPEEDRFWSDEKDREIRKAIMENIPELVEIPSLLSFVASIRDAFQSVMGWSAVEKTWEMFNHSDLYLHDRIPNCVIGLETYYWPCKWSAESRFFHECWKGMERDRCEVWYNQPHAKSRMVGKLLAEICDNMTYEDIYNMGNKLQESGLDGAFSHFAEMRETLKRKRELEDASALPKRRKLQDVVESLHNILE